VDVFFLKHGIYIYTLSAEYRMRKGDFAPTGPVDPKCQVEGVALPPSIFLLRKLG